MIISEKHFLTPFLKNRECSVSLIDLLVEGKLAKSKSEARRLIEQNSVKINDITCNNIDTFFVRIDDDQYNIIEIKKE